MRDSDTVARSPAASIASSGCGELRLPHQQRVSRFPFPTSHPCLRGRTDVHMRDMPRNGCSWFGACVCGLVRVWGGRWGFVCATRRTGPTNRLATSLNVPRNPATASSEVDPKSERHHEKWLRMVGAPTNPNDGNDRHTTVPNAAATHQPADRKASTARKHRRNRAQPEHSGGAAPHRGQPRQPVVTQQAATRHAAAPRCHCTTAPRHHGTAPPRRHPPRSPRAQPQPQHRR